MGTIYKLTFPSGKSYIGVTTKTAKERFSWHRNFSKRGKQLIYKAWRKYGQPSLEIISIVDDKNLFNSEIEQIKKHNTLYPNGYNMTEGGEVSPATIPEIAKRISESSKGKKMSKEACQRMSDSQKRLHASGYVHPMLGKKQSLESRRKMSETKRLRFANV